MSEKILSSGFIVFRRAPTGPLFLLIRNAAHGHWDFPKGHLNPGENELAAALRELREETSIASIKPIPDFREQISYHVQKSGETYPKEVTYFLGEAETEGVRLSSEHSQSRWASLYEALTLVQFDNARHLLEKAARFLQSRPDPLPPKPPTRTPPPSASPA